SGIPFNSLKLIYFSAGLSEIQFNSLKFPRIMGSGAQIILKRKGDLMMHERMPHWLTRQAFLAPDKLALEMPGGDAWTFTTLRNESELFARKLAQLSIQKGDKVAILSNNHLDAVRAIFACSYLGVVAVMLNTRLTQQELHYQLANAEVDILLTRPALQEEKQLDFSKQYTFTDVHELKERDIALIDEINLADPFTMMFTSGTTGNPKAVVHTYGNHYWSAVSSALNLGLHDDDKWLLTLPVFHIGGFSILMKSVIYGMSVYFMEKYERHILHEALVKKGVTIASLVTLMLKDVLEDMAETQFPSTVRCILLGGGSVPKNMLDVVEEKQVPLFQSYGMTETSSQIVTLSKENVSKKLGSAGKPLFPATVKISNENESGIAEISVKGPMVMNGYFKNDAASKESCKAGWLYTGDVGYREGGGFWYEGDRRTDLIISGGENIYPTEIENALLKIDEITDAAVIGVTDERWGQVPVACLVSEEKLDGKRIIETLEESLASYKIPREFHQVESLPRNASNKVMRHKLVQEFDPHHA